jgi:hypothetical protein
MVIENHPRLEDGTPFPTLYWLTCPLLVRRVSTLESGGEMAEMSERLGRDASFRERLGSAVERLRVERDEHERIAESGGPPGGGPDRVKCLHAHAAQELASPPDPVGALSLAQTGWPDCRVPCVAEPTG